MGMFLSMSGIIGKTHQQVQESLANYANQVGGGIQIADLTMDDPKCCAIEESNGNTTIHYPSDYLEWDRSSEYMSKELNAPVFSFHIHDGDLWMYVLYVNGEIVDQFNPIPDYWDENITADEIESWQGNAAVVAKYTGRDAASIEKYLTRWVFDSDENEKAYPDDTYVIEDWQLLDFMKRCGLPFPLDEDRNVKGQTYRLWTKESPLPVSPKGKSNSPTTKPWWQFWG